jgi:hypothetical protein
MNMPVITIEEIKYAVGKMENKKSTGGDEVAIEGIKLGGDILLEKLQNLFNLCVIQKDIPKRRKTAVKKSLKP